MNEARKSLAALRRGGSRARKRGARALGHWPVLRKWLEPKWLLALMASLWGMRSGCQAEQGTQQVATSMVAMVGDQNRDALEADSLRREVGWLKERGAEAGGSFALQPGAKGEGHPIRRLQARRPDRVGGAGDRWRFSLAHRRLTWRT